MFFNVLLVLIIGFVVLHLLFRPSPSPRPFTIAHRGAAGLKPENTLAGISEAIKLDAAFTEIDIRQAADGVLVVMHDQSLTRTTGRIENVEDLPSTEITKLKARSGVNAPFSQERIPTLDAVLDALAKSKTKLVIEVKYPAIYRGIEEPLVEALDRAKARGRVVVGSFDHAWLVKFHAAAPDVPITPIADWHWRLPPDPAMKIVDVDWRRVILDPTFVRRMHAKGRQVWVWTVDSPDLIQLMWWLGVDGVTTNRPDLSQALLHPHR